MAKNEEEEKRDSVDQREPFLAAKIDKIVPLIEYNGQVHKLEEIIQTKAGDLSAVYQKIHKDFHGNLKAVKLCRSLAVMTTEKAFDFMRTFMPLAKALGLIPSEDLVDLMGGDGEPDLSTRGDEMRAAAARAKDKGVSTADMAPPGEQRVVPIRKENAIDRARAHLEKGEQPGEPITPDTDRDLADAGGVVGEAATDSKVTVN